MDEELHIQRLRLAERVDESCVQVGQQHHVGVIHRGVARNGRSIEGEAFISGVFIKLGYRNGQVLFNARNVGKLDVYPADVIVPDVSLDSFRSCLLTAGFELTHW